MDEVSVARLYALRAMYLLTVVGFSFYLLPNIVHHERPWTDWQGVVNCMLLAFWTLSIVGLRYPLQMLPVMIWEFIWKFFWMLLVAYPHWSSGQLDEFMQENIVACSMAVLIPLVVPWRYVFLHYIKKQSDPWRAGKSKIS